MAGNARVSKGSLEGMERLIAEETYNQFGEKVKDMGFDIIFSGDDPNTCNTISEYLHSYADPEGAHEGIVNVNKSKYRHVKLPLLATTAAGARDTDKRYYWGLASSKGSSSYLGIWEEPYLKKPTDLNAGEEFSTDDWNYGVRGGYGMCTVGAVWIKFSDGTGAA